MDDLFLKGTTDSDATYAILEAIEKIASEKIHKAPKYSIEIFNQIIQRFPDNTYKVASAHFGKILCYEELKQHNDALNECEAVLKFPEFSNLTKQIGPIKKRLIERSVSKD